MNNTEESHAAEFAMRDATVPSLESIEELQAYITDLVDREHDYGTCVYAMSMAATAAFNFVARSLGVTGFQAGCADMDIIRRTRLMEGPFMITKAEDALYPQYNLVANLKDTMKKWESWLAEKAAEKLAKHEANAHPDVVAHWRKLAAKKPQATA